MLIEVEYNNTKKYLNMEGAGILGHFDIYHYVDKKGVLLVLNKVSENNFNVQRILEYLSVNKRLNNSGNLLLCKGRHFKKVLRDNFGESIRHS